jgi:hypothetical protein
MSPLLWESLGHVTVRDHSQIKSCILSASISVSLLSLEPKLPEYQKQTATAKQKKLLPENPSLLHTLGAM